MPIFVYVIVKLLLDVAGAIASEFLPKRSQSKKTLQTSGINVARTENVNSSHHIYAFRGSASVNDMITSETVPSGKAQLN